MKPVVLITGASQGIGAAIAKVFAQEIPGVELALVARNKQNLTRVAKACVKLGADAQSFACDVADEVSVRLMAGEVAKRCGPVDVLINNAGQFMAAPFVETSVEDFDRMIAVNLRSVFLVSRAFVPGMVKRGRGDVFSMSSTAGLAGYPGDAGYCAAKFGVAGLSKVMRAELKSKGVRVCCVHPGATVSPSWDGAGLSPQRLMPAEDVARAFLDIYRLSRRTVVEEIILRPQLGDL